MNVGIAQILELLNKIGIFVNFINLPYDYAVAYGHSIDFDKKGLNESQCIALLLHELGHIIMDHNIMENEKRNEWEADCLAVQFMKYYGIKENNLSKVGIYCGGKTSTKVEKKLNYLINLFEGNKNKKVSGLNKFNKISNFTQDKYYREKAKEAFYSVLDYLKNIENNDSNFSFDSNEYGWSENGNLVFDHFWDLPQHELKSIKIIFSPSGKAGFGRERGTGRSVLILDFLKKSFDASDLALRFYIRKSRFIHEYIHYLDDIRGKNRGSLRDNEIEYYNSPEEFNAYFQQAMSEIDSLLKDAKEGDNIYNYILGGGSRNFINWVKRTKLDSDFIKMLTPENKRKLDKRIYQAYLFYDDVLSNL